MEERLCTKCNDSAVETEYHLIMKCEAGKLLRQKYWEVLSAYTDWGEWSDDFKFKFLMLGGNDLEIVQTSANLLQELVASSSGSSDFLFDHR